MSPHEDLKSLGISTIRDLEIQCVRRFNYQKHLRDRGNFIVKH